MKDDILELNKESNYSYGSTKMLAVALIIALCVAVPVVIMCTGLQSESPIDAYAKNPMGLVITDADIITEPISKPTQRSVSQTVKVQAPNGKTLERVIIVTSAEDIEDN